MHLRQRSSRLQFNENNYIIFLIKQKKGKKLFYKFIFFAMHVISQLQNILIQVGK